MLNLSRGLQLPERVSRDVDYISGLHWPIRFTEKYHDVGIFE